VHGALPPDDEELDDELDDDELDELDELEEDEAFASEPASAGVVGFAGAVTDGASVVGSVGAVSDSGGSPFVVAPTAQAARAITGTKAARRIERWGCTLGGSV
jgi:hypothetical protein